MPSRGGYSYGAVDLAALAVLVPVLQPIPRRKRWLHVTAPVSETTDGDAPAPRALSAQGAVPSVKEIVPADEYGIAALLTPEEAKKTAATDAAQAAAQAAAEAAAVDVDELPDEPADGADAAPSPAPVVKPEEGSDEEENNGTGVAMAAVEEEASNFLANAKVQATVKREHIFISGPPGVGKTTLVQRLVQMIRNEDGEGVEIQGFYTEEVRAAGQRAGFDVVSVSSKSRHALARIGKEQPKVGKYTVDVAGFEKFALPMLAPLPKPPPPPDNPRLYTAPDGSGEEVVGLIEENLPAPKKAKRPEEDLDPFIAAAEFLGPMKGYYFGRDTEGQGYYLDPVQQAAKGDDDEESSDDSEDARMFSTIFMPSLGEETTVDHSTLSEVPEGWTDPLLEEWEERRTHPRICVCDEVGKMELLSVKFGPAFMEALQDGSAMLLGTLPQPAKGQRDHEIVDNAKKRTDARVFKITRNNRDALVEQIYAQLRECLGLGPPGTGKPRSKPKTKLEKEAERIAKEEDKKVKEDAEAIRRKELKAKRLKDSKKREKQEKAQYEARIKQKVAAKKREMRKARADVRKRAREASKQGTLAVVEEDDLEVHEEHDLGSDDSLEVAAHTVGLDEDSDVEEKSVFQEIEPVFDVAKLSQKVLNAERPIRKPAKPALAKPALVKPALAKPNPRQIVGAGKRARGAGTVLLDDAVDEVL